MRILFIYFSLIVSFSSCSSFNSHYTCRGIKKKGVPCRSSKEIESMVKESDDPLAQDLFIPPLLRKDSCKNCSEQNELPRPSLKRIYLTEKEGRPAHYIYFDRKGNSYEEI